MAMAQKAVQIGYDIMNGKKPAEPMILMPSAADHARQRQGLQGLVRRTALTCPADRPAGAGARRRPSARRGRLRAMADVVCFGDLLIDFVPTVTGTGLGRRAGFRQGAGRCGGQRRRGPGPARVSAAPSWARSATTRSAISWPTRCAARASTRRRCAFEPQGAHGAGLRLLARRRRARVPVLPPPQRRHAVHAGRGRRGRDRRSQASSTSTRSAWPPSSRAPRRCTRPISRASGGKLITYDVNLRLPLWPDAEAAKDGMRAGLARAHDRQAQRRRARVPDRQQGPERGVRSLWHDGLRLADPEPRQRRLDLVHQRRQP